MTIKILSVFLRFDNKSTCNEVVANIIANERILYIRAKVSNKCVFFVTDEFDEEIEECHIIERFSSAKTAYETEYSECVRFLEMIINGINNYDGLSNVVEEPSSRLSIPIVGETSNKPSLEEKSTSNNNSYNSTTSNQQHINEKENTITTIPISKNVEQTKYDLNRSFTAEDLIYSKITEEHFVKSLIYGKTSKDEINRLATLVPKSQLPLKIQLLYKIEIIDNTNKRKWSDIFDYIKKYENGQLSQNEYEQLVNDFRNYKEDIHKQIELENAYNILYQSKFESRSTEINNLNKKIDEIINHNTVIKKNNLLNQSNNDNNDGVNGKKKQY